MSKPPKTCPQGVGWGPQARYPAKFSLKRVPRDPFSAKFVQFSLCTRPQRGQHGSTWVKLGSAWVSKWHHHGLKWVQKRLKAVKSGQKRSRGSNGPQNGPTWPQNCVSRQPGGSPSTLEWVHWGLGQLKGGYSLSSPGFEPKVYIGYPPP